MPLGIEWLFLLNEETVCPSSPDCQVLLGEGFDEREWVCYTFIVY